MKKIKESSYIFRLYKGMTYDDNPRDFCNFSWVVVLIFLTMPITAPVFFVSWIVSTQTNGKTLDNLPFEDGHPVWTIFKHCITGVALYFMLLVVIFFVAFTIVKTTEALFMWSFIAIIILLINIKSIFKYVRPKLPQLKDEDTMGVFGMLAEKVKAFKEKRCPRIEVIRDEEQTEV